MTHQPRADDVCMNEPASRTPSSPGQSVAGRLAESLTPGRMRTARAVLLGLILAYAAILRLDGLFVSYGPFDHPAWLVRTQGTVTAVAAVTVPVSRAWPHADIQRDGGDPVNYLKFSREMRSFYQAHVREPVFLAATRVMLVLSENQDVAVSLASVIFSVLLVFATYLLGAAYTSPIVGLAAAAALAIEHDAVGWSFHGWRDEASGFFCILSACALVRLHDKPGRRTAVLAGVAAAGACLTRLSSFVFLVPALLYVAGGGGRTGLRTRVRVVGIAVLVMLCLVAPYLVNCARTFGDPLYAINYHVLFYTAREHGVGAVPEDARAQMPSAFRYVSSKFRDRPLEAFDTAIQGLTTYPFENKWRGFDVWDSRIGPLLAGLAMLGLLGWLVQPRRHLGLVVLGSSLVPYMMTWPVPGGGEWRFTLHAYPFFLVAAFGIVQSAAEGVRSVFTTGVRPTLARLEPRRIARQAAVLAVTIAAAFGVAEGMPYLVARDRLHRDEPAYVLAGRRDTLMFSDGWSDLVTTGNVVARFATQPKVSLHLPLPACRSYHIILRMDPFHFEGAPEQRVRVTTGGVMLGQFVLAWNPEKVGTYEFDVPAAAFTPGRVQLDLEVDHLDALSMAGDLYAELPRHQLVGFKLWYAGVVP